MSKQSVYPTRLGFNRFFDPRTYLEENFEVVDDEDKFTIQFIHSSLKLIDDQLLIHEFGGGPALYSVATLASKAREIHFSDAVEANLHEVESWIKARPGVFNWENHIRLALEVEGLPADQDAIIKREADMRRLITKIMLCDAQAPNPLEPFHFSYDLVTAHHCTDVAATNVNEWFQVIKNVSTLVRPGGYLLLSVTTGSTLYTVGDKVFRCVDLTPSEIEQGYRLSGYDPGSININTHRNELKREYSGIIMAIARKPLTY
jgi:nicotinamide N-methyltransferase/methyltransferase